MSKCQAGSCGISCAGTCGCAGSGDNCLCACYPVMLPSEGGDDPGPVVSGAGVVAAQPIDIDFKDFPLAALATVFIPGDLHDEVCIPVAAAQTSVTRAERGLRLADLVRSLGLRMAGRAGA